MIGYTIEGLLLCLIATAASPRWELGPVAGDVPDGYRARRIDAG
jgi:hypothetical protein